MEKKIFALKFEQNERELLMFSIPAKDLVKISYFNPREIDRDTGIQRGFVPKRSKEIAKYIDSEEAVLANNIIINFELEKLGLNLEDVYNDRNKVLDLGKMIEKANSLKNVDEKLKGKIGFVIDGQHRLRAFDYTEKKDFPLVVTALINLSLAEIAEIFVKINYYQKPVNKSLALDLLGISQDIFPQYYKLHKIVKILNEDIESPFYNNIRMLGIGKGFISQASIIGAIEKYKIEKTLKELGVTPNEKVLYDVVWNFFGAVSNVFKGYWGEGKFLSKTIGIRALIGLMNDMLKRFGREKIEFSSKEIEKHLKKIKPSVLEEAAKEGWGGEKGVKTLYDRLKKQLEG
jgi:DGQHR domain-containing protein